LRFGLVCGRLRSPTPNGNPAERYERFFEVMEHLGKQAGRLLPKWPQPSSSENFPEYADVIIRLIDHVDVEGQAAPMLKAEMALTADFLRKKAKL
jgi:hypothetical protein